MYVENGGNSINVCKEDWFSGLSHLLGKVKMRFAEINKSRT